jgi:hypothetical protein
VTLSVQYVDLPSTLPISIEREEVFFTADESAFVRSQLDLDAIEGIKLETVTVGVDGVSAAQVTLLGKLLEAGERITLPDDVRRRVLAAINEKRPVVLPLGLHLDEQASEVRLDLVLQPILVVQILKAL